MPSSLLSFAQQQTTNGWSYQTALDRLELDGNGTNAPPRMDLASIIAAKRKSMKKDAAIIKKDIVDASSSEKGDDDDPEHSVSADGANDKHHDDFDGESAESVSKSVTDEMESSGSDDSSSDDDDDVDEVDDAKQDLEQDTLKTRLGQDEQQSDEDVEKESSSSDESEGEEDQEEARKVAEFFDNTHQTSGEDVDVFTQLALSRPLLRGVAAMGFVKPTAIQSSVIPVALAGRDICASAVTGSGKTAAFLLPILERLLYRPLGRTKCLILTPTRELAAQCLGMMSTLSQFTKISSALVVGGSKNMNAQMAELRARPQVIVATPGRLLDHVTNSAGVSLEDIEFLVLDEADRLLDLGFQDEVAELIKSCPVERQTLLFSATMNTKVDDLISLSMKRPVRVRISDKNSQSSSKDLEVAPRLEQEFVRIRSGNEGVCREAMLLALLTRTFSTQTIVFFDTKAKAHRMMILCGLCGIKCAELHGNLTQSQRLEALEQFRQGRVDVLLATDLAARGLDISRVETVLNFEMPNQISTYIHRIGRTARAGRGGKSCTLIGEGRRHLMKEIIKDASDRQANSKNNETAKHEEKAIIRSRSVPPAVVAHFLKKIQALEEHIEEVLQAEAVARMDRLVDMEATKAQNIIEHSEEIKARPQRQWFASEKQKKMSKEASAEKAKLIAEKVGTGVHRMTRKKRRAREAKEMFQNDIENEDDKDQERQRMPSVKMLARERKREASEKEKANSRKSIHDEDSERAAKKRKTVSSSNFPGDGTLFGEEKIALAPRRKDDDRRSRSAYQFKDYNPAKDGLRKGKKKAHHKFKSKSKHKRR